jgi:hypothetical protein
LQHALSILGGDDTISGGDGNDEILGGEGVDRLYGGDGSDTISEGPTSDSSPDLVEAGSGEDVVYAANGQATPDDISCQEGHDRVQADPVDTVAADCEDVEILKDVVLSLQDDTPVAQALAVANSVDAETEQLVAEYPVGMEEHKLGYVADDATTTSSEVTQGMLDALQASKDQAQAAPDPKATAPAGEDTEEDPVPTSDVQETVAEIDSVMRSIQSSGALIDEVEILTSTTTSELEQEPLVEEAEVVPPSTADEETMDSEAINNWRTDRYYAPRAGYVQTGQLPSGQRFVYQRFGWNSWRMNNLKSIQPNLAWEQEATYNNVDGKRYLGWMQSWHSDMPESYFDRIRGFSAPVTFDYSIGTVNAQRLQANRYYNTTIVTRPGQDNDGEEAGVNGQVGYREGGALCDASVGAACVRKLRTDIILRVGQYIAPGDAYYYSQHGQ